MRKLKKLGKLKLMSEKILGEKELVNFRGGSGATELEYCQDSYMIRSCNNLDPEAFMGWSYG